MHVQIAYTWIFSAPDVPTAYVRNMALGFVDDPGEIYDLDCEFAACDTDAVVYPIIQSPRRSGTPFLQRSEVPASDFDLDLELSQDARSPSIMRVESMTGVSAT